MVGRARFVPLLVFVAGLSIALPAASQESKATTVREALRVNDAGSVPDRLRETVRLVGVLTSDPVNLSASASATTLQDATGGIRLFTRDPQLLVGRFKRGDLVEVRGKIDQYLGMDELRVEEMRRLGAGSMPPLRDVLAADLHSKRYAGQLVRVVGTLVVQPDSQQNRRCVFRDRSGEITVFIPGRLLQDLEFGKRLMEGGAVEIVGIPGQRTSKSPHDPGYLLVPRDPADIHFAPVPPYRTIAGVTAVLLLLGVSGYLWMRRRSAERRAREIALLSEGLKRSEEALRRAHEELETKVRERTAELAAANEALQAQIAEREQTEKMLAERTAYLDALIENSPLAIVVHDAQGLAKMCNPAFVRLLHYRQEEILGTNPNQLVAPEELTAEAAEIIQRAASGEVVQTTTRRRRKDGVLLEVEIRAVPLIVGGEMVGTYALYEDVTQRMQLGQQLRQAQKMEAVGRLAGGIAHDFNNLMGVIIGYCDLLLEFSLSPDRVRSKLEEMKKAGQRAASLTRQLLAFSRQQVLEPKVLDLNIVVAETEKMLRRLIGEDIELVTVLEPDLGRVKVDRGQLEQVILNLAVNARDAMPRGGRLTINTANVEVDGTFAGYPGRAQPGSYVLLLVADTGMGMDKEVQTHIFEPFFTTKEKGKGTGLGLATVYGIVKQSNGYIWVYSEPGHGTTFKVYLPRVYEVVETRKAGKVPEDSRRGSETILVAEDEESMRELTQEILEASGYTVLVADNGAKAIQLAEEHPGQIDVLLTDVVMPGMGGRELSEQISMKHPEARVLYMSGYTDDAIVHHGVSQPSAAFIQKPFTPKKLTSKVRQVLDQAKPSELVLPHS